MKNISTDFTTAGPDYPVGKVGILWFTHSRYNQGCLLGLNITIILISFTGYFISTNQQTCVYQTTINNQFIQSYLQRYRPKVHLTFKYTRSGPQDFIGTLHLLHHSPNKLQVTTHFDNLETPLRVFRNSVASGAWNWLRILGSKKDHAQCK